jgi:hypothetical protein
MSYLECCYKKHIETRHKEPEGNPGSDLFRATRQQTEKVKKTQAQQRKKEKEEEEKT